MSEHRTIYPCRCGGPDYLDLSIWQEDGGEWVHVFSVINPPRRFIDRLRGAWGILTGRDHYVNSEVILERDQVVCLWQDLRQRVGGLEVRVMTDSDPRWREIEVTG